MTKTNPWHPALPTSARARRMLRPSSDGHALALTVGAATIHAVHASSVPEINEDARFIIVTAARLWEEGDNVQDRYRIGAWLPSIGMMKP